MVNSVVFDCILSIFIMLLIPVVSETPTGVTFISKGLFEVIATAVTAVCIRQPADCRFNLTLQSYKTFP